MSYKGKYRPNNIGKYKGDYTKITYRSLLELRFMRWCDTNPNILMWQSEEVIVPYISPVDNKYHRYFVDFTIMTKLASGEVKIYLVEIKPDIQTRPPKPPKKEMNYKRQRRLLREQKIWSVNEAKWKAAIDFCNAKNWEFKIITEKELGSYK